MATLNPLEQKARSSFRKGLLIAGLIGLLAALLLGYYIYTLKDAEQKRIKAQKPVAILTKSVKSGDEIEAGDIAQTLANSEVAIKEGIEKSTIVGMMTETEPDGTEKNVKLIAKIDLPAKTILTEEMFTKEENIVTNDMREQEYNVIILPSNLQSGDTIDIRLRLPSGEDYIVASKKLVKLPESSSEVSTNMMMIEVNEAEQLQISASIVEAYQIAGSKLYATKYTEPGIQTAAIITYMPPKPITDLVNTDPNIVAEARDGLISRYNATYNQYRQTVIDAINRTDAESRQSQLETGIATEISTQESDRRAYLESLSEQ